MPTALDELLPEGGVTSGEEGVLACIPAEEVRSLGVETVMIARGPDFVQKESAGRVEGAVQVVGHAAFLAAGGADECPELGFEQTFLAFLGAEDNDQTYRAFGELRR